MKTLTYYWLIVLLTSVGDSKIFRLPNLYLINPSLWTSAKKGEKQKQKDTRSSRCLFVILASRPMIFSPS